MDETRTKDQLGERAAQVISQVNRGQVYGTVASCGEVARQVRRPAVIDIDQVAR